MRNWSFAIKDKNNYYWGSPWQFKIFLFIAAQHGTTKSAISNKLEGTFNGLFVQNLRQKDLSHLIVQQKTISLKTINDDNDSMHLNNNRPLRRI